MSEPAWTSKGGHFRQGDTPKPWRRGRREELVPYGKATPEYRDAYYRCPECNGRILPEEQPYRFCCENCDAGFKWGVGALALM